MEKTHTCNMSTRPQQRKPVPQQRLEIYHGDDGVEEEAHEVREGRVGHAGRGPGTVMVHSRNASCDI